MRTKTVSVWILETFRNKDPELSPYRPSSTVGNSRWNEFS
jgi:hypothetical protein